MNQYLGVILDPELCLDNQICNVVKNSFYQLKSALFHKDLEIVIHAFITSLDYCNSPYLGLPQSSLRRLQLVQNAAARILTGTRRREHITPILASLHWLTILFRVQFNSFIICF